MLCTLLAATLATCAIPQLGPWSTVQAIPGFTPGLDTIQNADLNGDGLIDLILGSKAPNRISVALGQGAGRFSLPREQVPLPSQPNFYNTLNRHLLHVVDLDGDGALDLYIAENRIEGSFLPGKVHVAFGNGDGTFGSAVLLGSFADSINGIRAADLDADGHLDLAVAAAGTAASYLRGLGGRQFAPPAPLVSQDLGALDVEFADMDSDGFLDLVASALDPLGAGALRGTHVFYGDGSLPFQATSAVQAGLYPQTIQLGDLDLDGDLDIVTSGATGQEAHFIEALPGRTFAVPTPLANTPLFSRTYLYDVNGDGLPDLVDGKQSRGTFLTLNLGQLQFAPRVELTRMGGRAMSFFDEDGDGAADCVAAAAVPPGLPHQSLTFFRGTATPGTYGFAAREALEDHESKEQILAVPSVVEGRLDLVSIGSNRREVAIRRARPGGGAHGTGLDWDDREFLPGSSDAPIALGAADFDGDGAPDLAVAKRDSPVIVARYGDGAGGYGPETPLTTLPSLHQVDRILTDDLDGDGTPDLTCAGGYGSRIYVSQGLPSGGMTAAVLIGTFPQATALAPIDFDSDGDKDIVLIDDAAFTVIEAMVDSAGALSFAPPRVLISPVPRMELAFTYLGIPSYEDAGGDGFADFGYIDESGTVRVFAGRGDGTFSPPAPVAGPALGGQALTSAFALADLDENGTLDLVSRTRPIQGVGGWIHWCPGTGPGQLAPPQYAGIDELAPGANSICLADLDADGDVDLVLGTTAANSGATQALYFARNETVRAIGESYCAPLTPNSTGSPGSLTARGSLDLTLQRLELVADQLPAGSFGYFLCSQSSGVNTSVPGSVGTLCLGGAIGRFNQSSEIGAVSPGGRLLLEVDVDSIPTPNMGRISIMAGQTWHFQAWHRDVTSGGTPSSNFTDAVRVPF